MTVYEWRKMNDEERQEALARRQAKRNPWHMPPHENGGENAYHLTAACYEHRPHIGTTPSRIECFEVDLLDVARSDSIAIHAWAILPNHYHLLVRTDRILKLIDGIGRLHGRSSFEWNGEEDCRGRRVWYSCVDRRIRSERHFWATMNYVHHNPVRQGYVGQWSDWPYSSAVDFLQNIGKDQAAVIWREYPILEYGKGWDDPEL